MRCPLRVLGLWTSTSTEREARARAKQAERLLRRMEKEQRVLNRAVEQYQHQHGRTVQRRDARSILAQAGQFAAVLADLQRLEQWLPQQQEDCLELVISSLLLKESFERCTQTRDEGMHFLAGIEVDSVAVATHVLSFPYAHRSIAAAGGERQATNKICIELDEAGHLLLAIMHSHPGSGRHANHHSSVDARTQANFELTRRMIGGIWSRDGFLRFFSVRQPFTVRVAGNYVEQINEMEFRLLPEAASLALSAPALSPVAD